RRRASRSAGSSNTRPAATAMSGFSSFLGGLSPKSVVICGRPQAPLPEVRAARAAGSASPGGEDVLLLPPEPIGFQAGRDETQGCLGERQTPFPAEPLLEHRLDRVQVKHVGGRVFELRIREVGSAPIRRLLLL